jgi:putative SOS response-associated peptidase YedK
MRWGLIPSWAKEATPGLINARAETVKEKPSFRSSFKSKRCLIPSDGFIEWKKENKEKIPYYIFLKNRRLFAFAGIWSEWKTKDLRLVTYSIITTRCNSLLKNLHDRMPVILAPELYDTWLTPHPDLESLSSLLVPYDSENMEVHRISKEINSPKNDREELLANL